MNFLGSLQNLSGTGPTLEGFPSSAWRGLSGIAQDRCCAGAVASNDPMASLAVSDLLFQQSLYSLSALLLQVLRPAASSALAGGVGVESDKAVAAAGLGRASGADAKDSEDSGASKSSASTVGALSKSGAGGGAVSGRPNGYNEIVSQFGQPGDRGNIVSVPMKAGPGGRTVPVQVHKKIADRLKKTFEEINAAGLSDEIKTFDGSYNARKKRGGSTWSVHSWGLAVDLNAGQYPMGTSAASTSPRYKQVAQIFARNGFYQLGNDPMHFQFATGY